MKVFLTGATGFLGSALMRRFIEDECDMVGLVRKKSTHLPSSVKQIVGDLTSFSSSNDGSFTVNSSGMIVELSQVLSDCKVVVHAAARAHEMPDEFSDPITEYRKVNRDATLALATMASEAGVNRFVFVSSIGVNGKINVLPFSEIDDPHPHDPYSISKFEAEQGLLSIAKKTGMEVVIVRPPLVYGSGAKGNFATLVKWVKKGVPLPLASVNNYRSLVALDNLVDFLVLCADGKRSPKAANQTFLISDGKDISTSGLLRKVEVAYGVKSRLLPIPAGVIKFFAKLLGKSAVAERLLGNLQVDSSKARNLLGWQPVITIDEQLKKMSRKDIDYT